MPAQKRLTELALSPTALIHHLPPDPLLPTPSAAFRLASFTPPEGFGQNGPVALKEGDPVPPSMTRRARMVRQGGMYTFTSPLPLDFPYDVTAGKESSSAEDGKEDAPQDIESYLASLEPSLQHPSPSIATPSSAPTPGAGQLYSSPRREALYPRSELLSLSNSCAEDLLPELELLGPEGAPRQELLDFLSGKAVLASVSDSNDATGFAPYAANYAGHQFGSFAGQLGDGRAITVASFVASEEVSKRNSGAKAVELQLKGAGRTPYSRFADGLAVLRSSVREYLGAEAMAALSQPTSRALSLVSLPTVRVVRERVESGALVCRAAPSWIRIGTFEVAHMRQEWDALASISRYVGKEVLGLAEGEGSAALRVVREVAARNARMIAGWQSVGFMHGVMNTDNISVLGLCIDYGPYAFMDDYDSNHICNHSDEEGRYSYRNQPTMGVYAVDKLLTAVASLVGYEQSHAAAGELFYAEKGWAEGQDISKLAEEGRKLFPELKKEFQDIFQAEYVRLMRGKLGLKTEQEGDFDLVSGLLDIMEAQKLDYSITLRRLSLLDPTDGAAWVKAGMKDETLSVPILKERAEETWNAWLPRYASRLQLDGEDASTRAARMDGVNPRFVLRQWVLEEVIAKAGEGDVKALARVLDMCENPFKAYDGKGVDEMEAKERERLCEVGSEEMKGFQCSCSS